VKHLKPGGRRRREEQEEEEVEVEWLLYRSSGDKQ